MKSNQTNTLNMSHAVAQALNGIVAANPQPALVAKYEALKAKIAEIETQAAIQALPITGKTVDRNQAFARAIDATLVVAGMVRSYARAQKLGDLEAKVRLSRTSFVGARVAHRVPLMQQVHEAAESVLPQLADVGVTAETLAGLKAKIDAADTVKTLQRSTIVERRVATKALVGLFRELVELLEIDLDPQMNALREAHPAAWDTYRAAREVINQPGVPAEPEEEAKTATITTAVSTDKLAA